PSERSRHIPHNKKPPSDWNVAYAIPGGWKARLLVVSAFAREQPRQGECSMNRRLVLFAAVVAAILAALTLSDINIRYSPWARTVARTIDERGPLSDAEQANIELFKRVSPSVVQVVARSAASNPLDEDEGGGAASGTGFVWDNDGHIVTNNHV